MGKPFACRQTRPAPAEPKGEGKRGAFAYDPHAVPQGRFSNAWAQNPRSSKPGRLGPGPQTTDLEPLAARWRQSLPAPAAPSMSGPGAQSPPVSRADLALPRSAAP